MTTLLIKGGSVLDGTGASAFEGDVLVEGDRIAAVLPKGEETPSADQVLDATGCMVSPGFIDMHSHADWALDHVAGVRAVGRTGVAHSGDHLGDRGAVGRAGSVRHLHRGECRRRIDRRFGPDREQHR